MRKEISTAVLSIMIAVSGFTPAFATIITLDGSISGTFNGLPVSTTVHATSDTSTPIDTGSGTITFNQGDPAVAAKVFNSILSIFCSNSCSGAFCDGENVFSIAGGNYKYSRTLSYNDFPSSTANISGTITSTGDIANISGTISGTFPQSLGPLTVTDYKMLILADASGHLVDSGSATLNASGGTTYTGTWDTTYTDLFGNPISVSPTLLELAEVTFTTQSVSGNMVTLAWDGSVCPVPEPSSFALLGFGVLGLLLQRWSKKT